MILGLPLLGHCFLRLGMRMERLVVLRAMGGLGPSIALVTTWLRILESSTSQSMVFRKLEESATETSEEP